MVTPVPSLELGLILIALALAWAAWKILNWVWLRPKKLERFLRQQGLKGNSYRLLHGDFKEMNGMLTEAYSRPIGLSDDFVPRVFGFRQQAVDTYGKDCFMWAGTTPQVTIMNPDQIKYVFSKNYEFPKPASSNPLGRLLVTGLFNYEGEKWAMHRKIINPAFNMEKLKLMLPAFYACCNELVTKWEGLLSDNESVELDAWIDLQNLTRDAISRTAFGSSFEEGKRIFELQAEQGGYAVRSVHSVYIPGMRFLPTKMNRKMKKIHKEVESLLRGIISKREKAMREEGEAAGDDLLGLLLESNVKEIQENNSKIGMSILDVIEECKLFYLAGQETTASLLAWTMFLLSIHPQWQTRARDEVLQVFGRENKPDFDGLNHLKIVTMILYEVLRLYPPIQALAQQVVKDTKLGNLTIPAGVQLTLPIVLIHHDRELWGDDAKEFKPERFSDGISMATKNRVCYVPFGWGPRICIGQNFALIEAKMALVVMLQRFMFELSPSYAHAPISGLALQPQHGLQVILRRC